MTFSLLLVAPEAFGQKLETTTEQLQTNSGYSIHITYFPSQQGKKSPVMVFLHGEKGNRKRWAATAAHLQRVGCAAVTVDLRKHGDSVDPNARPSATTKKSKNDIKPNDYKAMVMEDMEVVKQFLMEKHQAEELNVRKMGIVAIGPTVPVAVNYAVMDWNKPAYPDASSAAARTPRGQDVRGIVMISPESSVPGLQTVRPIKMLKNAGLPFAIINGEGDKKKKKIASKMFRSLQSGTSKETVQRMYHEQLNTALNGENLLVHKELGPQVTKLVTLFVDKHLARANAPWRDRESRLNK